MVRRTALLVTLLAAAAIAIAPIAWADPITGSPEVPPVVPTEETPAPPVDARVHGDVTTELVPTAPMDTDIQTGLVPTAPMDTDIQTGLVPTVRVDSDIQTELVPTVRVDGGVSVDIHSEDAAVPGPGDDGADSDRLAAAVDAADSVAPVAAATAAFGLFALLAFGLESIRVAATSAWTHVARFARGGAHLLVWLPLFSRIGRADLLENPVRASIHAAVTENPGLSLTELKSRTGIAWGTAVHHLQRLESNGLVVSATQRAHRRYFATGTPAAQRRNDIAVMAHPTARRIATLVSGQPGIDQTGICRALGLKNPAASKHLCGFESQGLVLSERDGRKRVYRSTPSMDAALPFVQGLHIEFSVPAPKHVGSRVPAVASG